jgi:Uma2 family endonuclease
MQLAKYDPLYTIDQYLAIERAAQERHIYLDGSIYMMAGESGAHGDISTNIVAALAAQLEDTPCRVRIKDTKVRSGETPMSGQGTRGMFSYPDIVVICG